MINYSVTFNGNDISEVPGVTLYNYNATNLPERDVKLHKLARRSLSIITSSEYTQKFIPVFLKICSGGRQDTEATITAIKGLLQPQNGDLELQQSGEQFRYTATMNEFDIEWENATAWAMIMFIASTPIAESVEDQSLFNFNITSSSASASFTVGGSYIAEPEISLIINSVTGGTGEITVYNGSTNQGITISGTFANGDQLVINSSELVVTVNGTETDYTGAFPTFPPGVQIVGYSDTFTTRNVDIDGTYNVKIV